MTVHNGPGIRTLIQFKGCPLRCLWCSTPESQAGNPEIAVYPSRCIHCNTCLEVCPHNAVHLSTTTLRIDRETCVICGRCAAVCNSGALQVIGKLMTVAEIVKEAKKDEIVFKHSSGGVTLSGGEPLLEIDFTLALLQSLSENRIDAGIDTCGYIPSGDIEMTLPYISFFLWDIKIMDEQRHIEFTGVSNKLILENLIMVSKRKVPVYIRIPVIPGYNDNKENIRATCKFAQSLESLVEIDLLPLHHLGESRYASLDKAYPVKGIALIVDKRMQELQHIVESYGLICHIVG
jgi:pyruvate formate lyase activating enzyme